MITCPLFLVDTYMPSLTLIFAGDFVSSEDFLAFIRNENEEEWSLDQFVNAFCDGAGTPLGGTNDEGEHEG